jgi:adenylate cyclase
MNDYYEVLFKPISAHNGIVSDVVGDAAMAIWAKPTHSPEQHQLACLAALQIQTAIQQFNQAHPAYTLPTRIGLHSGDIVLGHVGALDHYEYRAIGDIVNTASRIEGINKLLGTHILISDSIKDNLTSLLCRAVGQFQLAGKQTAIRLYELVGVIDHIDIIITTKINAFEDALALFSRGEYSTALSAFAKLIDQYGDGPSAYYHARCAANLDQRVHDEHGIIRLSEK